MMRTGENYGTVICYDTQMIVEVRIADFNDPNCKTMQAISYEKIPDGLITEEYKEAKRVYKAGQAAKNPTVKLYLLAILGYCQMLASGLVVLYFAAMGEIFWLMASLLILSGFIYRVAKALSIYKKL
ncbi:MAG: hypothetical protein F9K23_17355 [Bacteroidetes bacterium]|nr:MAG: hypothetical protein F9K23_17355 [Bacteroidota bacterium]